MREYLAGQDVPCVACGYNLRGNEGLVCPECGTPVRWARRGGGGQGLWWAGLIGMCAAYAMLAVLVVSAFFGNVLMGVIAALFVVDGPRRVRRWVRRRRGFAELPRHVRQQMAAVWWLGAAVAGALVAGWVRELVR